ncbi:hypothetical protein ABH935_005797 [Catenulispora sp. GAS73]|uniref:ricin-type beta-trefoil lectin domain protein n=1 Tax=Catenulispora sp. GAS73 TaxID=3156269 RepID=UPI0035113B60
MDASGSQPGHQGGGRQVRGRSLHDVLHDPGTGIAQQAVIPLDPSRVALIAHAILTSLAAGAVHGYINPYTILLTDDGTALLVGDRVAPGATPANDVFALGMALFEAVEGYAPHPAEALPAMRNAGALGPLIEALTEPDPARRVDAAGALGVLKASAEAAAASAAAADAAAAAAADATETSTLPKVQAGAGPAGVGRDSKTSDDTSLLPPVPTEPAGPAGPAGPPLGPARPLASGYPAYEAHPPTRRKPLVIGGVVTAVVLIGGIALGVAKPWHRTDNSVSTVPGAAAGSTSVPTTPAAATSAPTTTAGTPTPPSTTTAANSTTLVSMTLCLDAASDAGGVHSGAKVTAATCQGSPNQAWQIQPDGTIHSMAVANLCLDAAAPTGKVLNGAQVSAWTCHGGPNQDWVWNANGTVSPVANTTLCLDAAGPVPIHAGANVTAWPCNGGPNEKWAKQ